MHFKSQLIVNVLETEGGKRGKVFSGFITNRNKLSVHDKICPLIQCELAGKNHSVMCWPALEVAEKWKRKKMTEDHLHSSCSARGHFGRLLLCFLNPNFHLCTYVTLALVEELLALNTVKTHH